MTYPADRASSVQTATRTIVAAGAEFVYRELGSGDSRVDLFGLSMGGMVAQAIIHGDSDRMVPPGNADALSERFAAADVRIYPDSGHGVVSQNHGPVTGATRTFLRR